MKRKIFSLLLALCVVLTFVVATSAEENQSQTTTKYNVTVSVDGGVVSESGSSETGATSKDISVTAGSTLSNALSGLTFTSSGAGSSASPVSRTFYPQFKNAKDIATGLYNTYIIDANGDLWVCGSGSAELTKVTFDNGVKFNAVAVGYDHTLLLDTEGNVWSRGSNDRGQLGRNTSDGSSGQFKMVSLELGQGVTIKAIAAGTYSSLILDTKGYVWECGRNDYGQLGLSETSQVITGFTKITGNAGSTEFKAISANSYHSLLLDKDNNVWVAGYNGNAELGTGDYNNVKIFTKLEINENDALVQFTAVSAGSGHSLLLDNKGSVWACGSKKAFQAATGCITNFTKIYTGKSQIEAGNKYSVLLDEAGCVWTCGINQYGNLGSTTNIGQNPYDSGTGISKIKNSDGTEFTGITKISAKGTHTVFIDKDGYAWTVGDNTSGKLGRSIGSASYTGVVGRVCWGLTNEANYSKFTVNTAGVLEVVYDAEAPKIEGIANDATYDGPKTFTVSDDYGVASVTIDGVAATATSGKYTINAKSGKQTVVATDTSGNTTTITVTVSKADPTLKFNGEEPQTIAYKKGGVTIGTGSEDITYTYNGDGTVATEWYNSTEEGEKGEQLANDAIPTDVGTYYVGITATGGDNYNAVTTEKLRKFEITRANATLKFTEEGDKSITYTGNKVKAGLASDDENTYDITYKYDGDGNVATTWYGSTDGNKNSQALDGAPENAGTYYLVLTTSGSKNYNDITTGVEKKVTITQATAEIKINEIADITYSGNPVTYGTSTENITYTYTGDSDDITVKWYKDNNGSKGAELEDSKVPTDAGTYWIGVSATEGTNYGAVAEQTKQFKIVPADASLKFVDAVDKSITYRKSEVTVGSATDKDANAYDITYNYTGNGQVEQTWYKDSVGEDNKLSSAPENVGTYYVVLTADKGTNYKAVTAGVEKKVTITQAEGKIEIGNIADITYSGSAVTAGLASDEGASTKNITYTYNGDNGVINVKWYNDGNDGPGDELGEGGVPTDAGTYWIGVSATEGTNYTAAEEVTKKFTIKKYGISNTISTTPVTLTTATDTISDPTITGVGTEEVSGTYTYTYTDGTTTVTGKDDVIAALIAKPNNTYPVTVKFTPAANSNYKGTAEGTINVKVEKTTPEITITAKEDITYDGQIVTAGKKPEEGESTNDITYTYAGNNDNVTVTWYRSDNQKLGEAPTAAGNYKVGIKAAADSTYNEVTEKFATFEIKKKSIDSTISGTATIKADTADFDDPTISGAVGTETVPGDYIYTYGETTGKEAVIAALKAKANGEYDITVKFTAADDSNYTGSATGTMKVTVSKETPTITITPASTIEYDGSEVEVGTSGKDINYEYTGDSQNLTKKWYESKEDGSIDKEKELETAPKNAGTYYIGISAPATSTYDKVNEVTEEFTIQKAKISDKIEKATATVEANTTDWTDPVINGVAIQTGNEKVTGTYQYSDGERTDKTEIINALKAKKNGTYEVSVEFKPAENSNYTGTAKGEITVTVQKEAPTITFTGLDNITYDGEAVTAGKTGTAGVDITYGYEGGGEATVTWCNASGAELTGGAPTAAGDYKIKVYVAPTSTYNEVEATGEFKISPKEIGATITGAEATINANTADFDNPEIKGVKEEKVEGTYAYKYTNGQTTTTGKAEVINALKALPNGSYEVNVEFTPTDTNYTGKASGKMTVTVAKPKAGINITVKENIIYDKSAVTAGKAPETGESTDDITYTYNGNATPEIKWYENSGDQKGSEISAPTAAGTYWVGISAPATTSYDKVDEVTQKFTIQKAAATITFEEPGKITYNDTAVKAGTNGTADANITYTYDGDNPSFTTTWYGSNEEGNIDTSKSISAPEDAGTYYVRISASDGTNYKAVEKTQQFTISQADASITINTPGTITYDESPVVANVEGTSGADITYEKVGDGQVKIEWYKDGEKLDTAPTDAGSYSVKIWAEASKNYTAAAEQTQEFTISQKDASITINEPSAITYSGNAVTVGTAGAYITYSYMGDGEITTTWYGSKEQDAIDTTKSSTTAPKDAGVYYVGIKAAAGTNYAEVAEQFKKFTISRATASITIADPGTITYNGNAVKAGKADVADADIKYIQVGDGEPVIEWFKDNESAEDEKLTSAPKDAGKYIVKISANSSTNYLPVAEQTKTFTILPATASITINDPGTINYDGEAVTIGKVGAAGTTGTTEGTAATTYDITYNYDGDNDSPTITWYSCDSEGNKSGALTEAPKTAGTYYVGVSAAATNNYKEVTEVTQKFTIVQKSSYGGGGSGAATPSTDTSKNSGSDNVVNKVESKKTNTPATTTATITNTTATTTTTPATGDKEATTTTTITSTVDTTTANKIVEKAVENKSKEVVIDAQTSTTSSQASSTAGSTEASGTTTTEVTIPTTTITQLSEKTSAEIVIKTNDANITLDKKTVAAITKQINEESKASDDEQPSDTADQGKTDASTATGETTTVASTLKLTVTTVEQGKSSVKFDVKIETASGEVKSFKGGKVTVTVNLNSEIASKKHLVCVYINDHNVYSRISGKKNADGTFTFTTKHFSTYAIMTEEEVDKIIAEQTAEVKALEDKIQLKASSAKTSKGNVKVTLRVSKGTSSLKKLEDLGYTVKYRFYRSTKKSSGYKAMTTKASKAYINMNGKKGTRYYYKARVMVYDSEGTLVASTAFKQCKYATRQWTKK